MSNPWSITNRAAAGSASTASIAAPASAKASNICTRLRSISVSLAGSSAGTDQIVVRDGASGSGTILKQWDLSVPANGSSLLFMTGLDIRNTPGNALTVEGVSGVTSDREAVNAEGDFVPQGYPMFQS